LVLRALILRAGTLRALLHLSVALLHLLAACAHLLVILILLIAVEHAQYLASQVAARLAIARASFRMSLRILIDHRLNALLLIAGKVDVSEAFHPAMLEFRLAWRRGALGRGARWLGLLGVGAERHCERDRESARCQKGNLHGTILRAAVQRCLKPRLGPGKRLDCDRRNRFGDVRYKALKVIVEEL
jgi:hypothetical protein